MKRVLMILALGSLLLQFASALCTITPSLINQDPLNAVPGETVKLLFQLTGTENPECGTINLEFVEKYPFTLDSSYDKIKTIRSGTYERGFNSFWIVPYKVRIDKDALDGDQEISLKTWINEDSVLAKVSDFNVSVEEVRTDFVVTLDSYSFSTKKLVIGIVNVGEKSAKAITVRVPTQQNAFIDGGDVKILGELDSNEDTTVTFDADLNSGPLTVELEYNDEISERRNLTKEVIFNGHAFESTREKSSVSMGSIFLWIVVIGIILYLYISRRNAHKHIQKLSRN